MALSSPFPVTYAWSLHGTHSGTRSTMLPQSQPKAGPCATKSRNCATGHGKVIKGLPEIVKTGGEVSVGPTSLGGA